jgi:hypothetical protein
MEEDQKISDKEFGGESTWIDLSHWTGHSCVSCDHYHRAYTEEMFHNPLNTTTCLWVSFTLFPSHPKACFYGSRNKMTMVAGLETMWVQ